MRGLLHTVKDVLNIPDWYSAVNCITANNRPYLNTWIKLSSTDRVIAEFANLSSTWYGALYGTYATWESSAFYANQTYYWYDAVNNKINTWIVVNTDWHIVDHDFVNWTLTLDGNITTFTPFTFTNSQYNYLFARYYGGSYGYLFRWSCKYYKVYRSWEIIVYLVPVKRNSDSVLGMYDLIWDQFLTNIGSWSFTEW